MQKPIIPVNRPVVSTDARRNMETAVEDCWLSSAGPFVKQFEDAFASYIGMRHGVSVSSGTAALHVALLSLGIGPEDEVIVPAFAMGASWMAVLYTGARPVFVDCESETYNIDPAQIEQKITRNTKAIMAVHIYGHPSDMKAINAIARAHKLFVIEDAAEAHGAEYQNKKAGSLSDVSCFSFYANKIIATGEGGMLLTDNEDIADRARKFRDLHHVPHKRFIHDGVGYNYRYTNIQAGIGLGELKNIDAYLQRKKEIAHMYGESLQDIPGITLPKTKKGCSHVFWMYGIVVDPTVFPINRDRLRGTMQTAHHIETRDFFYGPREQPVLKDIMEYEHFPVTDYLSHNGLYIPSGLGNTTEEIQQVIYALRKIASF